MKEEKTIESHADKLRKLLNTSNENKDSSVEYLKSQHKAHFLFLLENLSFIYYIIWFILKINVDKIPDLNDLVRLLQTTENVNQQILFENKYLKEETARAKATILKLIEENTLLHRELKNITVLEILGEFQQQTINSPRSEDNNQISNEKIKNKKYKELNS